MPSLPLPGSSWQETTVLEDVRKHRDTRIPPRPPTASRTGLSSPHYRPQERERPMCTGKEVESSYHKLSEPTAKTADSRTVTASSAQPIPYSSHWAGLKLDRIQRRPSDSPAPTSPVLGSPAFVTMLGLVKKPGIEPRALCMPGNRSTN